MNPKKTKIKAVKGYVIVNWRPKLMTWDECVKACYSYQQAPITPAGKSKRKGRK